MLAALMIGAGGLQAQIAPPLSPLLVEEPGLAITSRAAWQRQREVIRNRWQSFLGEWPREKAPLRTKVIATEELEGFTRQHVTY